MSTAVYPLAMRCDTRSQSTVLAIMETMFGAGTTIGPFVGGAIENWFAYLVALVFLLFRPQGLFGEKIIERV